jgi:glycerate 2-kinase
LHSLFRQVLKSADPHLILPHFLPDDRTGKAVVIGAGKAVASMASSFERNWHGPISGLVVTPYGHREECDYIEVAQAAHPVPDKMSLIFAKRLINIASGLNENDHVFCFLSGGGSSLLMLPPPSISVKDKKTITSKLLFSQATITEINCVRKHLSLIKGGRLGAACFPALLNTYAISDVVGDDPSVIASGPTVADHSSSQDAIDILNHYHIDMPISVRDWLKSPLSETLKKDSPQLLSSHYNIIASAKDGLVAAEKFAKLSNIQCINLKECQGDARKLGAEHANLSLNITTPTVVISGGETTVTIKGCGKGGRNSEYLLSLAIGLKGAKNIYAIAADTDGIDGSENNAGAFIEPHSLEKSKTLGDDPLALLNNNDSFTFFNNLNDLILTGPTKTNINDFRAILILPKT